MIMYDVYHNIDCDGSDCKNKTCYGIGGGPYDSGDVIAYCWEHLSEEMQKKHIKRGHFPKEDIPWINNYLEKLIAKVIKTTNLIDEIKSYLKYIDTSNISKKTNDKFLS